MQHFLPCFVLRGGVFVLASRRVFVCRHGKIAVGQCACSYDTPAES